MMPLKGIRKEWRNKNFYVVVPCNDGNWCYGASDDIWVAWEVAFKYKNAWVKVNE